MRRNTEFFWRLASASIAVCALNSCEVVQDVAEFCGRATIEVTTTADFRRPCREAECSLWGAIAAANVCNSGMTVVIPEYARFVIGPPPPDAGRSPPETVFPAITGELSIQGNGAEVARLRTPGVPSYRFFVVQPRANLSISDLSLQGGGDSDTPGGGGAIINHGTLALQNIELLDNRSRIIGGAIDNYGQLTILQGRYIGNSTGGCDEAGGGALHNASTGRAQIDNAEFRSNQGCGGAILNAGQLEVVNSTFADNQGGNNDDNTYNHGGAIMNESDDIVAVATIRGSTFTGNRAMVGAAIVNFSESRMSVHSSTLSGNMAYVPCPSCTEDEHPSSSASAAIYNWGELKLEDVTIASNTCDDALPECGGGLVYVRGSIEVRNSIIAENSGGDCKAIGTTAPRPVVMGTNLDSDGSCVGFSRHGAAHLGPLQDNGGATWTHALLPGSPAIDAGTSCLARDQRGEPRAWSLDDPCDIGAFELQR